MNPTATIETAVKVLNDAFAADPAAIQSLLVNRVPCNQALVDDPYVVVDQNRVIEGWHVGMLGVLNGVLDAMTGQRVAARWSEAKPGEPAKLLGFQVYEEPEQQGN